MAYRIVCSSILTLMLSLAATPIWAQGLKIDIAKSSVTVEFRQMNVPIDAEFKKVDIQAQFDPKAPDQAKAMVLIETASFDFGPGAEDYNAEVRAPVWFDSAKHPIATFEGLEAKATGNNKFDVIGKLTVKGISKDVIAPFELKEQGRSWVLEGQVSIKRLDFDIGQGEWKDTSIVEDQVVVKFRIVTASP